MKSRTSHRRVSARIKAKGRRSGRLQRFGGQVAVPAEIASAVQSWVNDRLNHEVIEDTGIKITGPDVVKRESAMHELARRFVDDFVTSHFDDDQQGIAWRKEHLPYNAWRMMRDGISLDQTAANKQWLLSQSIVAAIFDLCHQPTLANAIRALQLPQFLQRQTSASELSSMQRALVRSKSAPDKVFVTETPKARSLKNLMALLELMNSKNQLPFMLKMRWQRAVKTSTTQLDQPLANELQKLAAAGQLPQELQQIYAQFRQLGGHLRGRRSIRRRKQSRRRI